jgi:hypothetical protein
MNNNYPTIYLPTAPVQPTVDLFDRKDALDFCTCIKDLLFTEPPKEEEKRTIVHPERVYYPYPQQTVFVTPSYAPPTVVHNHYSEKKVETNEGITTAQMVAAGIMIAAALPIGTHFLSKDYNRYVLYERAEEICRKLEWPMKEIKKYSTTPRERRFVEIYRSWKENRLDIWNDIKEDAKIKVACGIGTLGLGLSIVFGSPVGVIGGALLTGYSIAKFIWKADTSHMPFDYLAMRASEFIKLVE